MVQEGRPRSSVPFLFVLWSINMATITRGESHMGWGGMSLLPKLQTGNCSQTTVSAPRAAVERMWVCAVRAAPGVGTQALSDTTKPWTPPPPPTHTPSSSSQRHRISEISSAGWLRWLDRGGRFDSFYESVLPTSTLSGHRTTPPSSKATITLPTGTSFHMRTMCSSWGISALLSRMTLIYLILTARRDSAVRGSWEFMGCSGYHRWS